MKENKKAILEILKKKSSKKDGKFESLVLNLALQKIDSDSFECDEEGVYTQGRQRLVFSLSQAETFAVPEGVEVIGEMAFRGKKNLKNIIFSSTVKEIEQDAFYDCDELDNVYLPAGIKEVKGYAFAECDKLKKVTFGGTPKQLSRHAFDDCDQLHDILVPYGQSKAFRKALHYIDGDTDFIVTEMPPKEGDVVDVKSEKKAVKEAEKAEKKAAKEAVKAEKKAAKDAEKAEKKAVKEADKAEKKVEKKVAGKDEPASK